jgi:hypothetical protein
VEIPVEKEHRHRISMTLRSLQRIPLIAEIVHFAPTAGVARALNEVKVKEAGAVEAAG